VASAIQSSTGASNHHVPITSRGPVSLAAAHLIYGVHKQNIMTAASRDPVSDKHHHADRAFVTIHTLPAPRALVFKLWTEPEHLRHWWGPKGSTVGACQADLRPGGTLLYSMRMTDGNEIWGRFLYREVLPPDRLVFLNSFSDQHGSVTRATFNPTWPLEIENAITLSEQFGQTNLTLVARPYNASNDEWNTFEASFDLLRQGFSETFDRLAEYLPRI
jgi:uncharacterized protein YndB with AHSA1/START domain